MSYKKPVPDAPQRLVAYYRYSGGSRQTEQSIEGQRRDCEAYASAVYKKKLRDNGVEIIYAAESNLEGAEGIIIEGLMEALAEYYSAELAEKARRGIRESALKGKSLGGPCPLGLMVNAERQYAIDPQSAPTVRYIFEQYAAGQSVSSIIRRLNAMGIRTAKGNSFDKSSIKRIIKNELYHGVYVSKKFDVRIEGAVPPIIEPALWEQAQLMFERNRQSHTPHARKADYILSGKLYCAECGRLMKGICGYSNTGRVYHYYSCPGRSTAHCTLKNVPQSKLEKLVVETTSELLLRSENVELIADAILRLQQTESQLPDAERTALEQTLADVRRKIGNILSAIENGTASAALTSRLADLEQQESSLVYDLSTLPKKEPFFFGRDELIFLLQQFRVAPSERTQAYCRRLVDTFVSKIELSNHDLRIHFNLSKETEEKLPKKSPRSNCPDERSTEERLVGDERIELPQVESESTALPLCKSPISCCVSLQRTGQRVLLYLSSLILSSRNLKKSASFCQAAK